MYHYWKEHSGEYDPKGNVVAANHISLKYKTENELKFEKWAMREFGMTNEEQTEHTLPGLLSSVLEISNVIDVILLPVSLFSAGAKFVGKEALKEGGEELAEAAGKNLAQMEGKEALQEAVEKGTKELAQVTTEKTMKEAAVMATEKSAKELSDETRERLAEDIVEGNIADVVTAMAKAEVRNIVNTQGSRNDLPLTIEQIKELKEYAKKLGFPEEKIHIADNINTSNTGMLYDEILLINNDVLPTNLPTRNPNSLVSGKGTIAHEIIGHYETALKGTSFNQYDIINNQLVRNSYNVALDEAQASIRAARFAPDLTYEERVVLIKDGIQRLKREGLKIKDVRHLLDILER